MKSQLALLFTLVILFSFPQDVFAQAKTQNYSLTIDSQLEMDSGQKIKITAETGISYYHRREGTKLTVGMNEVSVKAKQGDSVILDMTQNKDLMRDGKETTKLEDANDALKKMLADSFKSPVAQFSFDKNGALTALNKIAKPGAQPLLDNGQVENIIFLHPPFFEDKKEWTAPAKFSIGNGNFARGNLNYKVKSKAGDRVTVDVSGNLTPTGKQSVLDFTNGNYSATGVQTYDLKMKQWLSANIEFDVKFELAHKGKSVVKSNGTIKTVLKTVEPKAEKAAEAPAKTSDKKGN